MSPNSDLWNSSASSNFRRWCTPASWPFSLLLAALAVSLHAQDVSVRLYSEFHRPDPFGAIVPLDAGSRVREILSPAVPRNAFTTFHVAVTAPANTNYFLFVQTYPPKTIQWNLYEEKFAKFADLWIPDRLVLLREPYFGVMPDPDPAIPGQTTNPYLLDIWVPGDLPVSKVRLEVLVKTGTWSVYPLEIRLMAPSLPILSPRIPQLPPPDRPAVAFTFLTGTLDAPDTVRAVIRRNAIQDAALGLRNPRSLDAEAYLRARQKLLQPKPAKKPSKR